MNGPDTVILRRRPVRAVLDIADGALRADIADICDDAGIAVADRGDVADVVIIDRPVATALPAVAIAPDDARRVWPANVCAVVPADLDAETLAAVITVVAAGYALTARRDAAGQYTKQDIEQDHEREAGADDEDSASGDESRFWTVEGDRADEPGRALSAREREVLTLLAGGASNKEIALALRLSVSTVKFHVAAITGKLGARSRVDAVAIAVRAGLVMV